MTTIQRAKGTEETAGPFRDREAGARKLAAKLKGRLLKNPLVLAIPRGGVVTGAVLARELNAELDVVLSRKLRAPQQPELAIGAVGENGETYITPFARSVMGVDLEYIAQEREYQLEQIERRKRLCRAVKPAAKIKGRSVIITDDGVATGSSIIAAADCLKNKEPAELIIASPYIPREKFSLLSGHCDDVVAVLQTDAFYAVGEAYVDFGEVTDERMVEILRDHVQRFDAGNQREQELPQRSRN